jgi:hypothetical protein
MAHAAPSPSLYEPCRLSLRLPHWGWLLLWAAVLVLLVSGSTFGLRAYRQHVAIREIERLGGQVNASPIPVSLDWLPEFAGDSLTAWAVGVDEVYLHGAELTDDWDRQLMRVSPRIAEAMKCIRGLPDQRIIVIQILNSGDIRVTTGVLREFQTQPNTIFTLAKLDDNWEVIREESDAF